MRTDIGTREIITVAADGVCLRGTYHKPSSNTLPAGDANNPIGILFLNPGWLPRSGLGESLVYWADSFAKIGYPSFRLDMPSLGDSNGDLPQRVEEFVYYLTAGGHAAVLSHAIRNLVRRFGLSGAVVVGLCSGAVSALYAAGDTDNDVKGLILLDAYFDLPEETAHLSTYSPLSARIPRQFQSTWDEKWTDLRFWLMRTKPGGILHAMRDYVRYLRFRGKRHTLPKNANRRLVHTWERLASTGLPMLIFTAPSQKPRWGQFDYFRYFRVAAYNSIVFKPVEGTDHSFHRGDGKETVRAHTERWLRACFP